MGKSKQILAGPISLSNRLRLEGVDAFSTNFHLPKSTLVMLVSAFAGRDLVLDAYHHAIQKHYRFFQFWRCHVYPIKTIPIRKPNRDFHYSIPNFGSFKTLNTGIDNCSG